MASQKEIGKSIKRMTEKRSNAIVLSDKKPLFSEKAALELTQQIRERNSFRARSFEKSANRIAR